MSSVVRLTLTKDRTARRRDRQRAASTQLSSGKQKLSDLDKTWGKLVRLEIFRFCQKICATRPPAMAAFPYPGSVAKVAFPYPVLGLTQNKLFFLPFHLANGALAAANLPGSLAIPSCALGLM